ncbi:hypothetical protein FRC12_020580 [Ceratobasidium sp. 428]|nr:hypothetical protein FRC12_020580 [Ceratobasidium sp. 428]
MSAPTYIVQPGDVLLVPEQGLTQLSIEWQQSLQNKKADYLTGFVQVKGKGEAGKALSFLQREWYNTDHLGPKGKLAQLLDFAKHAPTLRKTQSAVGDYYELKVDGKSRYGQKNAKGEARFIVYHDTSRNPFQHRFMNQALRQTALGIGQKIAQMMGVSSSLIDTATSQIQCGGGDPLRKF